MNKGLEALERIENHTFPYTFTLYDIDDLKEDRKIIKQCLIEAEKNKKIVDKLKEFIEYAILSDQKLISLEVLKNVLKELKK